VCELTRSCAFLMFSSVPEGRLFGFPVCCVEFMKEGVMIFVGDEASDEIIRRPRLLETGNDFKKTACSTSENFSSCGKVSTD